MLGFIFQGHSLYGIKIKYVYVSAKMARPLSVCFAFENKNSISIYLDYQDFSFSLGIIFWVETCEKI